MHLIFPETSGEAAARTSGTASRAALFALQLLLVAAGLLGASLRAFPRHVGDPHANLPVLDATTIAWLGLVVAAVLLPRIREVGFGDLSLKLADATKSSDTYRDVSNDLASLTQRWSTSALVLLALLEAENAPERNVRTRNYVRDRIGEAQQFISDTPGSTVRIAIWIYDETDDLLHFEYSPHFVPTQPTYRRGEGFLGQAFLERRVVSEPDVRQIPSYERTRAGDPPYRGVLCVPLEVANEPIGVLTVDKPEATEFSAIPEEIARGLAAQCAYALEIRRRFVEAEERAEPSG